MATTLQSARRHHARAALLAQRAVREARKAAPRGTQAVAAVVATHQALAASQGATGVQQMLAEQGVDTAAEALLNSLAFTTATETFNTMLNEASPDFGGTTWKPDWQFDRLVASLVQDAGRAAECVAITSRPRTGWVRNLTPPSCGRCAVLAGRVYRYSSGFMRHPHDDCTTTPVREGDSTYLPDIDAMLKAGQIHGLSKADQQALADGADFNQVVNVRSSKAGLVVAGETLSRRGRLTPAGIYRTTSSRTEALAALKAAGYIR